MSNFFRACLGGLVFALVFLFLVPPPANVQAHEPDGDCHTEYKFPMTKKDHCLHACDHQVCTCAKPCPDSDDPNACLNTCMSEYAQCTNKCQ